jgi:hypothetical protein
MIRALAIADKQHQWNTDKERVRQTDEQLAQNKINQNALRDQARIDQENIVDERETRHAENLRKTMPEGPTDRATFNRLDLRGLAGGVIDKRPGAVLRLGAESNVGPVQTPGGAIAAGSGVQTDETFRSRGGTDWQAARQAAQERIAAQQAAEQARIEGREDQQNFLAGQGELNRNNALQMRAITGAIAAQNRNTLSPTAESNLVIKLQKDWDQNSKGVREIDRQYRLMEDGLRRFKAGDRNGGSQAVINTFNKILDPLSVVRESEYARMGEGLSVLDRFEGYLDRLKSGGAGIPEKDLESIVGTARAFRDSSVGATQGLRARSARQAARYQIPEDLIFGDTAAPTGGGEGGGIKILSVTPRPAGGK